MSSASARCCQLVSRNHSFSILTRPAIWIARCGRSCGPRSRLSRTSARFRHASAHAALFLAADCCGQPVWAGGIGIRPPAARWHDTYGAPAGDTLCRAPGQPALTPERLHRPPAIASFAALALRTPRQAKPLAVLYINFRATHTFSDDERSLARRFARQASAVYRPPGSCAAMAKWRASARRSTRAWRVLRTPSPSSTSM